MIRISGEGAGVDHHNGGPPAVRPASRRITPYSWIIVLFLWSWSVNAGDGYRDAMALQAAGAEPAAVVQRVREAAETGDRAAIYAMSEYLSAGHGVAADPDEARRWLQLAAGPGRSAGQYDLALRYLHGDGVDQDSARAAFWLRQAAARGHTSAQVLLAGLLERGDGLDSDPDAAHRWLLSAAGRGSAEASYRLALHYGMPEGERWLRSAAAGGHAPAQRLLGVHLARGGALPTAEDESRNWLELAADNGDARAMLIAGLFHLQGRGGPVDRERAWYWFNRAQLNGETAAAEYLTRLEPELSLTAQVSGTTGAVAPQIPEPLALREDGRVLPVDRLLGHGSGYFINGTGHLLTNQHVVELCAELRLPDGRTLEYVAGVIDNDIALLRAADGASAWLEVADRPVAVGQPVSVPVPGERTRTATVTAHERPGHDRRYLRFDARLEPGASGSPLLDESGRAVGLTVAKLRPGAAYAATGNAGEAAAFALRPELIREFVDLYGVELGPAQGDPADAVTRVECWY